MRRQFAASSTMDEITYVLRENSMSKSCLVFVFAILVAAIAISAAAQDSKAGTANAGKPQVQAAEMKPGHEYSGMYNFLKEGEFVQITVEDEGRVTGFVSRYGEGQSDKGAFLDQYFRSGKLTGNKLAFITETVHGTWFEFGGAVERGDGKKPEDEGYYVLKGTLKESSSDAEKKVATHSQDVNFKRFPSEASPGPSNRN